MFLFYNKLKLKNIELEIVIPQLRRNQNDIMKLNLQWLIKYIFSLFWQRLK